MSKDTTEPKRSGTFRLLTWIGLAVVAAFFASTTLELKERRTAEEEVLRAARNLYAAMEEYTLKAGQYPSSGDPLEETFDRESLEPLIRESALIRAERVTNVLDEERVSLYCSPDLPTRNHDFWALLVSRRDGNVKALVADTDQYPGEEGKTMRGVYLLRGDRWVPRGL